MLERQGEAPHDGEAEPETLPAVLARLAPLELLKDRVAPLLRDARPGVPHLDGPAVGPRAPADQHATAPRVAEPVGDEVLNHAPQEQRVGPHHAPDAEMPELQAAPGRGLRLLLDQRGDEIVDRERLQVRRHHAGVELGEIEQRAQQVLERRQAAVRLIDEARGLPSDIEARQRREREPRGVQRLEKVVADRGEDGRFQQVGRIGLLLRPRQVLVRPLDRSQGLLHLSRAAANLIVERDRRLEQGVGVRALIVGAFDARDELGVDLLELGDLAPQLLRLARRFCHGAGVRLRPIATPVKVWLTCIEVNCSP